MRCPVDVGPFLEGKPKFIPHPVLKPVTQAKQCGLVGTPEYEVVHVAHIREIRMRAVKTVQVEISEMLTRQVPNRQSPSRCLLMTLHDPRNQYSRQGSLNFRSNTSINLSCGMESKYFLKSPFRNQPN